jgi:DNA-binding transcriptional MocR family regulator
LRSRRDALRRALGEHLPELEIARSSGGLHLWAQLPDDVDDLELTTAAAARDVVVFPGRAWFAAEPPGGFLRLTYGGAPEHVLTEGVRRLADAMSTLRR